MRYTSLVIATALLSTLPAALAAQGRDPQTEAPKPEPRRDPPPAKTAPPPPPERAEPRRREEPKSPPRPTGEPILQRRKT